MPIDHNIPLGVKPFQMPDPMNAMARALQIGGAMDDRASNRMLLDEKRSKLQRSNRMYEIAKGGASALRSEGFHTEANEIEKGELENTGKRLTNQKTEIDTRGSVLGQYRSALDSVTSPDQAAQWLQAQYADPQVGKFLASKMPLEQAVGSIPRDPAGFQGWLQRNALGLDKAMGRELDLRKQGEVERHNQGTEGIQRGQLAVSQGNLGVAQSNLGLRRQELDHAKNAPKGQYDADRGVMIDQRTGVASPVTMGGKPLGPKQSGAGNVTEGERKAATLLQRMDGSLKQLQTALAEDPGAAKPQLISSGLRSMGMEAAANTNDNPARQRVEAAQLDILDAALTLGTGAAYTREQLESYRRSYFPQIGDKSDQVADKKARLDNILNAARIGAGRAAPAQSGATPPAGTPARITDDAGYNALPSGAEFVGPDGKTRRKP